MKPLILSALLLLSIACEGAQPSSASPAPPSGSSAAKIKQQLHETIIPSFKVVNATLPEAIAMIMKEAKAADPKSKPVPIVIDPDLLKLETMWGLGPNGPTVSKHTVLDQVRITLSVVNVTEYELLDYVVEPLNCRFTNTGVEIEGCKVDAQPLITRRYPSPGFLFDAKITDDAKCKAALEDTGVTFPNGSSAHYDAKAKVLTVRSTEESLDLVDQVVNASRKLAKNRR